MSLHGGGLGRHEGRVVFVEFSAPGDELLVEIIEAKKNHAFARIKEILKPSPERREAPCPAFGRCGGCNWQHLKEESQVQWKEKLVHEALTRAWGEEFSFLPLFSSPQVFRYRNRIQLKKQKDQVGYFEKLSHHLVPIDDCLLAEEPLSKKIPALRQQASRTSVENWEIALTETGEALLQSLDDRDLAFSQVNRFVNQALTDEFLNWAAESDWTSFWDLYSGSGNFSFPLAKRFPGKAGLGVELSLKAVEKARSHVQSQGWSPKRLEFFCADVGLFLRRSSPAKDSLVLVDPPRAGLDENVLQALALSSAKRLFYISCDPMTLARDLGRLKQMRPGHWKLHQARCFDMFPQTDHVETLVELKV